MIIDAFTFFNEKELVELRIKYLDSIVDYFVVVEADVTHTGIKKNWNFPDVLNNQLQLPKNWVVIRDETGTILYYYKPEFTWTKNRNDVKDFSRAKKTKAPKKTKGSKKTFKKRKKRKNITFKK